MERRTQTLSLWQRRRELPALPLPGAIAASVILCLIAALGAQWGPFALLSAAVSGTIFAALLLLHRSFFVLLVPAAAAGAVFLSTSGGVSAVLPLLFIPVGCAAAWAVYCGMSRMAASVLTASAFGVSAAALSTAVLVFRGISLSQGALALRRAAHAWLISLTLPGAGGQGMQVFSEQSADILVEYLTPIIPSVCVGVLFFLGCGVTALLRRIFVVLNAYDDFFRDPWHLRAGRGCAAVYCAAQCVLLLAAATPGAEQLYYAAYNVAAVFMLPPALSGFSVLFHQMRTLESVGAMTKAAVVCLAIMLAAAGIYWFFTAAALYGVYIAFRRLPGDE